MTTPTIIMTALATSRSDSDDASTHRRPDGDGGFALVLALLILVAVTLMAAGGYWVAQANSRTAGNHRSSARTLQLADGALSRFVGEQSGIPVTPRSYSFAEGSARLTSVRLGVFAGGHELYELEATAQLSALPKVTRTVTEHVMLDPLVLGFSGALVSGGKVLKQGDDGLVSGFDAAAASDCPEAPHTDRPGVIAEAYEQNGGSSTTTGGCTGPICGDNPSPIHETTDPLSGLDIDWQGILDGSVVDFDHVTPDASTWPPNTGDDWPVIFVDNSTEVELNESKHAGQGLLVVRGDLKLNGGFHWDGGIMVGGDLVSGGENQVYGAIATGLNELIGGAEATTDLGAGQKTFRYHSCNLLRALKEAGTLYEVPGSWREKL